MFFILSKLFNFAINPVVWIVVLLIAIVIARRITLKKRLTKILLVVIVILTNPYLYNLSMGAWQYPRETYKSSTRFDAAIVMGGISGFDPAHKRVQFLRGADRLFQAIHLYKQGRVDKIIFSGGSGYITRPEYKEGEILKPYIKEYGIPIEDFIVESNSRNTYDNAVFTSKLIRNNGIEGDLLLITSGFHMKRSLACFHKQGLFPKPYSADLYELSNKKGGGSSKLNLLIPDIMVLQNWKNFIHEIVGYYVYKAMGYL